SLRRITLVAFQDGADLLLPSRQQVRAAGILASLRWRSRGGGWRSVLLHRLRHLGLGLRQHGDVARRLDLLLDLFLRLLLWRVWYSRRHVAGRDRRFSELDHDGGALAAFVWGRSPEQERCGDRAMGAQDDGSAHQPADEIGSILGGERDHGAAPLSNPTR